MPPQMPGMMLWPHLTVQDVDATLAFYRDRLGFEQDLCLKDHDGTFMGSVEVGDTVIMFERPDRKKPPLAERGRLADIGLTILFPSSFDLEAFYADLHARTFPYSAPSAIVLMASDFAVLDPDGYCLVFAKTT